MHFLLRILIRAVLPPAIGLTICLGIIYFFPGISDVTYLLLMAIAFTIPQLLLAKD